MQDPGCALRSIYLLRCEYPGGRLWATPRTGLNRIWADGAYSGEELARWCEEQGGWRLESVGRNKEVKGFEVLRKRWIVERSFAWLVANRRFSGDYERKAQTGETFLKAAMIRLLLRRLASST